MEADKQIHSEHDGGGETAFPTLPGSDAESGRPGGDVLREPEDGDFSEYPDEDFCEYEDAELDEAENGEDDKDRLIAELVEENLQLKEELQRLRAEYEEMLEKYKPEPFAAEDEESAERPPSPPQALLTAADLRNLKADLAKELGGLYEERLTRLERMTEKLLTEERLEKLIEERTELLREELKAGSERLIGRQQDALNSLIEVKLNNLKDRLQPAAADLSEGRISALIDLKLAPLETELEQIKAVNQMSLREAQQALARAEDSITVPRKALDSFRQLISSLNERQIFNITPQIGKLYSEMADNLQRLSQGRNDFLEAFDGLLSSLKLSAAYHIKRRELDSFKSAFLKLITAVLDYTKDNEANVYNVFTSKQIKDILHGIGCCILLPEENDEYSADTMEIKHYKNTADPGLHNRVYKTENYGLMWRLNDNEPAEVVKKAEIVLYINY